MLVLSKVKSFNFAIFSFRWFCHFDDDNYVNVPGLVKKLQQFDYDQDWYLGKPSIPEPLEILDRDNLQVKQLKILLTEVRDE